MKKLTKIKNSFMYRVLKYYLKLKINSQSKKKIV